MRLNFFLILILFPLVLNANNGIDREPNPVELSSAKATQPSIKNNVGSEIYEHFCITCHQDGVANAPKLGNEQDWKPRLAGRAVSDLVASAISGLNAMPAQGTCTECTEDDLRAAIEYMIPKS